MTDDKLNKQAEAAADANPEDLAETTVLPDDMAVSGDDAAGSGGESIEEALLKAEATAEENWSKYLRVVAELENVRKRAARDVEKARQFGVEGLAAELLTVADSLEMGLETGSNASAESLLEGGRATLKQLQNAMEKFGIEVVSPEGEPFDPEYHEAMTTQEAPNVEPNSVIAVVQRGYILNGRLLRPARVIVSK